MQALLKRASTYEGIIAIAVLALLIAGGVAYAVDRTDDDDSDGVTNAYDLCPGTVPDQFSDWGNNRYLWFGGDTMSFILSAPSGDKVLSEFDSIQTKGCSCSDILKTRNSSDSGGQYKAGCTKGTIEDWIKKSNK